MTELPVSITYFLSYPHTFCFALEFDFLLLFNINRIGVTSVLLVQHIPRPRAVKIAFGEFTRSLNSDALQ